MNVKTVTESAQARSAGEIPAACVVVFFNDSTRLVTLPVDGTVNFGRQETCEVHIDDRHISRAHFRISLNEGHATLADLGSQNGTRLNDTLIDGPVSLSSGDVISIGGAVVVFQSSLHAPKPSVVLESASFVARLTDEVERALTYNRPLSVAVVQFHDQYSRQDIEARLLTLLRRIDVVGWVRNRELGIILPEAVADHARRVGESLTAAFAAAHVGYACCPDDAAEAPALLVAARTASQSILRVECAQDAVETVKMGDDVAWIADPTMKKLFALVKKLAQSEIPILISGETGSGKEVFAQAAHYYSQRTARRMVAVNCAALNESLLESELFGHVKGAFTGASTNKAGLFETADGGTVFLDEIGEMSLGLQAKLLRVLETKRLLRVGDTNERPVDFRLVAATHRDLKAEVAHNRFREDLYFRLSGATLCVPPLRSRPRELPLLAKRFIEEAAKKSKKTVPTLSQDALTLLAKHRWPGNVRELKNVLEFLVATCDGVIDASSVAERIDTSAVTKEAPVESHGSFRALADEVRELEQRRMLEALETNAWNQTKAANAIQMPLRTFVTRFKQFELGQLEPKK